MSQQLRNLLVADRWLCAHNSAESARVLLHVHLNGDCGSPSSGAQPGHPAIQQVGSCISNGWRPAPLRRMASFGQRLGAEFANGFSNCHSRQPAGAAHQGDAAKAKLQASSAATIRLPRSLRCGHRCRNFSFNSGRVFMPPNLASITLNVKFIY